MFQENPIVHITPLDDDNTIKEHLMNEPLHLDGFWDMTVGEIFISRN